MALFNQPNAQLPTAQVSELRAQGIGDEMIMEELTKKGFTPEMVNQAIMQGDAVPTPSPSPQPSGLPSPFGSNGGADDSNMYERIEQISESIIDEKWEDLINEVKKIIEWKDNFEETQRKVQNDVAKLKEDFKTLHQGVLGKIDEYDKRMRDVGTELNAVGKVFKDVIPEFVENVKELGHMTGRIKKK